MPWPVTVTGVWSMVWLPGLANVIDWAALRDRERPR